MAEWSKALDLRSSIFGCVGSNPTVRSGRVEVAEWSKALVLGTSHFGGVGSNPTTIKRFKPYKILKITRIIT